MGLWMTFENKTLFFQQGQWLQEFDNTIFSTSVNVLFYSPLMNRGKSIDHEHPPHTHQSQSKETVSSHITPFRMANSHFRYQNVVSPTRVGPLFWMWNHPVGRSRGSGWKRRTKVLTQTHNGAVSLLHSNERLLITYRISICLYKEITYIIYNSIEIMHFI